MHALLVGDRSIHMACLKGSSNRTASQYSLHHMLRGILTFKTGLLLIKGAMSTTIKAISCPSGGQLPEHTDDIAGALEKFRKCESGGSNFPSPLIRDFDCATTRSNLHCYQGTGKIVKSCRSELTENAQSFC